MSKTKEELQLCINFPVIKLPRRPINDIALFCISAPGLVAPLTNRHTYHCLCSTSNWPTGRCRLDNDNRAARCCYWRWHSSVSCQTYGLRLVDRTPSQLVLGCCMLVSSSLAGKVRRQVCLLEQQFRLKIRDKRLSSTKWTASRLALWHCRSG